MSDKVRDLAENLVTSGIKEARTNWMDHPAFKHVSSKNTSSDSALQMHKKGFTRHPQDHSVWVHQDHPYAYIHSYGGAHAVHHGDDNGNFEIADHHQSLNDAARHVQDVGHKPMEMADC